jgi:hypothetical protein
VFSCLPPGGLADRGRGPAAWGSGSSSPGKPRGGMVCTCSRTSLHCTPPLQRRPRAAGPAWAAEPGEPRRIPPRVLNSASGGLVGLLGGAPLPAGGRGARAPAARWDAVSADTGSADTGSRMSVDGQSVGSADTDGPSAGGRTGGGLDMVGTQAGRKWGTRRTHSKDTVVSAVGRRSVRRSSFVGRRSKRSEI